MSQTFKTEAFVLKKRDLLGKDTLIIFFTREIGKIAVLAKGIKKINSRRLPHTETGNLLQVVIYKKNERLYLQETTLISGFSEIKRDEKKLTDLYFFLFTLDRILPENQREEEAFKLTKQFFVDLGKVKNVNNSMLASYLNKLLKILGYIHSDKNWDELSLFITELIHEKIPSFNI